MPGFPPQAGGTPTSRRCAARIVAGRFCLPGFPPQAQCNSAPSAGNDVSFKLYWNNLHCIDGQPPDERCLNSQSKGFATNKQTAGQVQDIPGLGDQAFCFVAPPATVDVLNGWIYLTVGADSCVQAQTLAGMLLAKITA